MLDDSVDTGTKGDLAYVCTLVRIPLYISELHALLVYSSLYWLFLFLLIYFLYSK